MDDRYIGSGGSDTIDLSSRTGPAVINMAAGSHNLPGVILGSIENAIGTPQSDTFTGDGAVNRLEGRGGNDTINGRELGDHLDGGTGSDTVSYAGLTISLTLNLSDGSNNHSDTLLSFENAVGGSAADDITGTNEVNVINGGPGNDVLTGGLGADDLIGGADIDTASFEYAPSGVTATLEKDTSNENDDLTDVENLRGGPGPDTLTGDAGPNKIEGLAGDDTIAGLAGADDLNGGDDTDTLSYPGTTPVSVVLENNTNDQGDTLGGFENLRGSQGNDNLVGDGGPNVIEGMEGDDTLEGRAGADTVNGGPGSDTTNYQAIPGPLTINLGNGLNNQGDTLIALENVLGTPAGDTMTGDGSANVLTGGAGGDNLAGVGGDDLLLGNAGADTLNGGAGANDICNGGGQVDTFAPSCEVQQGVP